MGFNFELDTWGWGLVKTQDIEVCEVGGLVVIIVGFISVLIGFNCGKYLLTNNGKYVIRFELDFPYVPLWLRSDYFLIGLDYLWVRLSGA